MPREPWFVPDNEKGFAKSRLKTQHGVAKAALERHLKACHVGLILPMKDCVACQTILAKILEESA